MKKILLIALAAISLFTACDDTTDTLGASLTNPVDNLSISADTFKLSSRSIRIDSVLSRSSMGYLGKIKDPETGSYVTGNFMTQFAMLENYRFPDRSDLFGENIECDSIDIRLYYSTFYGDSLTTMKATVHELAKPMEETVKYYSNFDPVKNGYVRDNGLKASKSYAMVDYTYSDSIRNLSNWTNNLRISLNAPYTDKNGKSYNNYGTYLMTMYYEHPETFRNSYNFIHDVCPGFYITCDGGLGAMANIDLTQMNIYYKQKTESGAVVVVSSLYGTEEVLQGTSIKTNTDIIDQLVADNTCTYVKSPSGILTEITLPVSEIAKGHENDTINTAKLQLKCLNNVIDSKYDLAPTETMLMIQADSLKSFFEANRLPDYRDSYVATYSSNSYTFSNIASLIQSMHKAYNEGVKKEGTSWIEKHPNWNKVVLIPVTAAYKTINQSQMLTSLTHNMSLSSVKLVGGSENSHSPLTISIIYSKFKD